MFLILFILFLPHLQPDRPLKQCEPLLKHLVRILHPLPLVQHPEIKVQIELPLSLDECGGPVEPPLGPARDVVELDHVHIQHVLVRPQQPLEVRVLEHPRDDPLVRLLDLLRVLIMLGLRVQCQSVDLLYGFHLIVLLVQCFLEADVITIIVVDDSSSHKGELISKGERKTQKLKNEELGCPGFRDHKESGIHIDNESGLDIA